MEMGNRREGRDGEETSFSDRAVYLRPRFETEGKDGPSSGAGQSVTEEGGREGGWGIQIHSWKGKVLPVFILQGVVIPDLSERA